MGFEMRLCTPEHPEANGIAERFMAVELIMGRPLKTKIAALIIPAKRRVHEEVRLQDKATRTLRKQRHDKKKNATPTTITPGDRVLIKQ